MEIRRTERGWPGHFCCVGRCRFRRNTLLEMGEERIVVSTVGNMTPFREDAVQPMQEIGLERCWETMVFKACYDDPYWEADVGNEVEFESPWALDATANDLDANAMHERVVAEMTERMQEADRQQDREAIRP